MVFLGIYLTFIVESVYSVCSYQAMEDLCGSLGMHVGCIWAEFTE